jgi:hypothetical protein
VVATWAVQVFAVRADQGRLGELVPSLDGLVRDQPGVPAWRAALAYAAAQAGDHQRATAEVRDLAAGGFAALPPDFAWTGAMTCMANAAGLAGDEATARAVYERLAPYAGRLSWVGSCSLGPVDTALARVALAMGDTGASERHVAAAAQRAGHLGASVFLAAARAVGSPP